MFFLFRIYYYSSSDSYCLLLETEDLEKDLHHPKIQEILDCGNLNPDKFDVTRTGRNLWKVERGLNEKIVDVRLFFFTFR